MLSPQALIRAAAERPGRYAPTEWAALLQVRLHGKLFTVLRAECMGVSPSLNPFGGVQVVMQDRPVTNEDRILLAKTVGLPLAATKNPLQMAAKQMAAMLK